MNTPIHDELTIQALDWDHTIPCEAVSHEGQDHKADYLIVQNYCNCAAFAICEERVLSKANNKSVPGWRCNRCDARAPGSFLENHRVIPINK